MTSGSAPSFDEGTPQQRRRQRTRATILDAARHCFARYGFAKTTMVDIAERARLTRRTIYQHYPTKDDIQQALNADLSVALAEELLAIANQPEPLPDRLAAMMIQLHHRAANGAISAIEPGSLRLGRPAEQAEESVIGRAARPAFALLFERGELAPDLDADVVMAWLSVTDTVLGAVTAEGALPDDRILRFVRDVLAVPLMPAPRGAVPDSHELPRYDIPDTPPSREAENGDTRDRILVAALSHMAMKGVQLATMQDIADGAGVDRRTLYRHFPDREALVEEVGLMEARRVNHRIRRLLVRREDMADGVADSIFLAIRIFDQNPFKTQIVEGTEFIATAADQQRKIFPFVRGRWSRLLETMAARRSVNRAIDTDQMVSWLLLAQYALHRLLDLDRGDDAAIHHFIRRFIVDSIVTESDGGAAKPERIG